MNTKNLPLIIGISLPVVFIIIISLVVFVPSFNIKPTHNFVYTMDDNAYGPYNQVYKNTYKVENNQIALSPIPLQQNQTYKTESMPIYLYDVKTNSSHQITFDEAKNYSVDPGPSSPDGYTVKYEYNNDGIFELFGSSNNGNGLFIVKGNGKKRLSGLTDSRYTYYNSNFKLIGWIK